MNGENTGPIINSRHYGNLPKRNKSPFIIFGLIVLIAFIGAFFFVSKSDTADNLEMQEDAYLMAEEEMTLPFDSVQIDEIKDHTQKEYINTEEESSEFFYKRALQKEKAKDYQAAISDYDSAIKSAKNYSNEMFNSLNNRGFINAKEFKNYKAAMDDFNKIIKIETSKSNPNNSRLEAGYTNRAYVKKMKGDKEGACNDLYEALYLGNEKSTTFIEKQIEKNCY